MYSFSKRAVVVYGPPYDENSGGAVVLHTLCHLLNTYGFRAYYCLSSPEDYAVPRPSRSAYFKYLLSPLKKSFRLLISSFKKALGFSQKSSVNSSLLTPLIEKKLLASLGEFIVVYPEVLRGNPAASRNVVRWLLHRPGYFSKEICYGVNDVFVAYSEEFIKDFNFFGIRKYTNALSIPCSSNAMRYMHEPSKNLSGKRSGLAFLIKKGQGKRLQHDEKNAIQIDGLSHSEIIEIFDSVEFFISYDTYTAFSSYAALRGAISIVIPDDGVSEGDWYAKEEERFGVGYGLGQINYSALTRDKLRARFEQAELNTKKVALSFFSFANKNFD